MSTGHDVSESSARCRWVGLDRRGRREVAQDQGGVLVVGVEVERAPEEGPRLVGCPSTDGPSRHRPRHGRVRTQRGPPRSRARPVGAVQLDRSPHRIGEPVVVEVEPGRLGRGPPAERRSGVLGASRRGRPRRGGDRRGRGRARPRRWPTSGRCWSWPARRRRSAARAPARAATRTRGRRRCGPGPGGRGRCPRPSRAPPPRPTAGRPPPPPAATSPRPALGRAVPSPPAPGGRRS